MRYLVDGGELYGVFETLVRTAANQTESTHLVCKAVGGEVHLELTVSGTSCKVAYAHNFANESLGGYGIENDTFRKEFRKGVLIAKILVHEEVMLVEECLVCCLAMRKEAAHADGGHLDKFGSRLQAEIYTTLRTFNVDALDVAILGEVFHDGSTIEYGVDVCFIVIDGTEVVRYIAIDYPYASAVKEFTIG